MHKQLEAIFFFLCFFIGRLILVVLGLVDLWAQSFEETLSLPK